MTDKKRLADYERGYTGHGRDRCSGGGTVMHPAIILRGIDAPLRSRSEAAVAIARNAVAELRCVLALPLPLADRADRAIAIADRTLVALDTLCPPPAPE